MSCNMLYLSYQQSEQKNNLSYQMSDMSQGFRALTTEIALTDKYTVLLVKMPWYHGFREYTGKVQYGLRGAAKLWQTETKKSLVECLYSIYTFLTTYNNCYLELEKSLVNSVSPIQEKDRCETYVGKIIEELNKTVHKLNWAGYTDLHTFNELINQCNEELRNHVIPRIQKEIAVKNASIQGTLEQLSAIEGLIAANEKVMLDYSIGITSSSLGIGLGIGEMLSGSLVTGAFTLIASIIGVVVSSLTLKKILRELEQQRQTQKKLFKELGELQFEALYLARIEYDFIQILQSGVKVANVYTNLITIFSSIIISFKELSSKLNLLNNKLITKELRYVNGTLRDIYQASDLMLDKLKHYRMLVNLPIYQDNLVTQLKPNSRVFNSIYASRLHKALAQ